MFALLRRCHEIDLHCVHLRLHLFDSLVKPILWYGCEVWLPSLLSRHRSISDNPFFIELESMHKRFLKQCLGLRLSTSDSILMTELHRHPLHLSALRQTFTFRNKIMARHDNDLVKMAMLESIELAREGARCWASNLARYYPSILVAHQLPLSLLDSLSPVATPTPIGSSHFSIIRDRSDSERIGTKLQVYNTWFYGGSSDISHTFWFNLHRPQQIFTMARFRMGAHRLNIESERRRRHMYGPRSQRPVMPMLQQT